MLSVHNNSIITPRTHLNTSEPADNNSSDIIASIASVNMISDETPNHSVLKHKSAHTIQHFFKKIIAAKSYQTMFSNGSFFKDNGHHLPQATKLTLNSLSHLDKVSNHYLNEIKQKVTDLTKEEQTLFNKITNCRLHFRHQSNHHLSKDGILSISSNARLEREKIVSSTNTYSFDKDKLSNNDFVFFGLEFSEDKSQLPLNKKHGNINYGAKCYMLEEKKNYGYMTLTDHFGCHVENFAAQEHKGFITQFKDMKTELYRSIHGSKANQNAMLIVSKNSISLFSQDKITQLNSAGYFLYDEDEKPLSGQENMPIIIKHDAPIFSQNDMKQGLALHLIDFIRLSKDEKFRTYILSSDLSNKELDHFLNSIFHPEYHIPRMISTREFMQVNL